MERHRQNGKSARAIGPYGRSSGVFELEDLPPGAYTIFSFPLRWHQARQQFIIFYQIVISETKVPITTKQATINFALA